MGGRDLTLQWQVMCTCDMGHIVMSWFRGHFYEVRLTCLTINSSR